ISLFTAPAPTDIHPLSLHDALPIWPAARTYFQSRAGLAGGHGQSGAHPRSLLRGGWYRRPCLYRNLRSAPEERCEAAHDGKADRSEEHTSELQSPYDLVCRLLLEKK